MRELPQDELAKRQHNVAMSSADHLKRWLRKSGRGWLVVNSDELVDALPWPGGVQEVMDLLMLLAKQRATKPTGRFEEVRDPLTKELVKIPVMKGEALELEELDRAIRFLVAQALKHKVDWSLNDPAL